MSGLQLIATGGAIPGRTVTNEDLSRMVDTSDEWITSRTGIRTRHWCTEDESAATLAISAAKQALARSGLAPAQIGCCICATLSAPDATPSVACQVQAALGLPEDRPALDVNAACSGFLYGIAVARGLLTTLGGQYALVIGCEALSRLMDPADRSTCVLFGDGAGAAIFRLADTPFALTLGARGSDVLHAGGPSREGSAPITMDGKAVFRFAVDALPKCLHTVLDETRECNKNWEIDSKHRLWKQGFRPHDESTMGVTPEIQEQVIKMMLTEEDQLEDVTIEQWFSPAFFQSQLWYYWSSMLPFQAYHSLIEMRRYAVRFMHQLHLIRSLRGILRTKYDQYSSPIRLLEKYLADHGVRFVSGAAVTDMDIRIEGTDKTVTALHIGEGAGEEIVPVADKDLVFFTNGSMAQNSTQGSMTEAPAMNRDTAHRGCFSLWEKLAK